MASIIIEISPGELIDRLTILEIKPERLRDPVKLANVQAEHAALQTNVEHRSTGPTRCTCFMLNCGRSTFAFGTLRTRSGIASVARI